MERIAANIMVTDFPYVDCDVTVAEAEEYFEQGDLMALPVLNPDRTVFGLLTPRHFASFYRRPFNNPRAFHAWEICDSRPLIETPTAILRDIAGALLETSNRYALIVNEERQLVGIISVDVLLERKLETDSYALNTAAVGGGHSSG